MTYVDPIVIFGWIIITAGLSLIAGAAIGHFAALSRQEKIHRSHNAAIDKHNRLE